MLTGTTQCRSSPSRSNSSCFLSRISMYRSPGGPPLVPGSPLPVLRMRMPSSMPAGILHFQRLVVLDLALAVAGGAGLGNDLAGAVAGRAGLLHAEEALAHLHRALAVAGGAGDRLGAGLGAGALAGAAVVPARDADLRFLALGRFLERDLHRVAQVAAAEDLAAAALAAAARCRRTRRRRCRRRPRRSRRSLPRPGRRACWGRRRHGRTGRRRRASARPTASRRLP